MRILEIILLILNIGTTILWFKSGFGRSRWARNTAMIAFVFFVMHLIVERPRWQFVLIYLVTTIYYIISLMAMKGKDETNITRKRPLVRGMVMLFVTLLFIFSGILFYIFPVNKMQQPTGQYLIGTQSFDIIETGKQAIYSTNLDKNRKIKIQIWYPADETKNSKRVPWIEDGSIVSKVLASEMKFPSFALDQTALVWSNSFDQARISKDLEKYPVVIISHGWTGFRNLHTDLAEELASNGYIVIGIDHTYGSQITVFNDGEVAYLNKEALPDRQVTPNFLEYANTLVYTYAGDVKATLDEIEKMNSGQIQTSLVGKFDLSRIGLIGHSTGGGGGVAVALEDSRIQAIMGMDAWVEPIDKKEIEKGLKIPALFLRSGQWEVGENNENLLSLIDHSTSTTVLYQINGMTHTDFTMVYMYSPLTNYYKLTGELGGEKTSSIQKKFALSFFNQNLKQNQGIDLNNLTKLWKEVHLIKLKENIKK